MGRHEPPETLGQRIARLRSQCGWTQQQLAERIAASRVAVSHFEMGMAQPSERTVVLLAGLFKIDPLALVANTQYPEAKIEKLPAVSLRYTEAELQIALLRRDMEWAARMGEDALAQQRSICRTQAQRLLEAAGDRDELRMLEGFLAEIDA
ncbi:helix-turn-helix transcriptional regulator [Chloroflexia bacterium SDU3-3]|nr:helix-turn-helix transcriptional regulator [Chloroflexia bacterium SDU3-3]